MTDGRVLHAGLHVLDRQMRDRHGRLCGKVDDLELERNEETGAMYVTAVLSGPGHLLYRTGRRRIGTWLAKLTSHIERSSLEDPGRIPYDRIKSVGVTVDLAIEANELATFAAERWTRDHIVGHVPGSRHDADE